MAQVDMIDVAKTYDGAIRAVVDATLSVADGEFLVLVGPSGCGKSTLLRLVAGLESLSSGQLLIAGLDVSRAQPGARDIAMVFQSYALYPHMSVRQNMAYGLKNRRIPRADIQRRIGDAAAILQITELLDRKPRQLSGGQRQRVAMGRAIVREPRAFLFDEPLSNLDAKLRMHMRTELKSLHRRLNGTFIYVTHDQVEAMSMADRIVVMNGGRIEQIGTPRDLYDRPATRFVAEFIGAPSMNLIPGSIFGAGVATIGIRPEALSMGPAAGPLRMSGTVVAVEDLGADRFVHVVIDGCGVLVVARAAPTTVTELGAHLTLSVDPAHALMFDNVGTAVSHPAAVPLPGLQPT